MRNEIFVLDASVIVKWFSNETNSEKAREIRDMFVNGDILIVCPDLILYEITNALRYANALNENDVKDAVESLYNIEIDIIVPTKEVMRKSIEFAKEFNITVYDAVYISLSEILNVKLVTADEKLIRACKNHDYIISLTKF
ncbi:MAG TPA: PIN domain-containing protein [Ignavibacteria bacterium]|nr:PIN domain-containing protein [Ignavibacteria bacterium]